MENNQWSNHNGKPLVCGQLRYIPNVFAPSTDNEKNEYLGLLKNNFFSGSHVFEWFDESKKYVQSVIADSKVLLEISTKVQKIIPIKLESHSDRLGNFILQISCFSITSSLRKATKGGENNYIILDVAINPQIAEPLHLTGVFWREVNGNMIDFQKQELQQGENIILFNQINGRGYYTILDNIHNVICAGGVIYGFMETCHFSSSISEHNQRIFKLPSGDEQRINMSTLAYKHGIGTKKDYRDWIYARNISLDKGRLKQELKLAQFKAGMRDEALGFIRELIEKHGESGIYLWDSYLNANDLLETVFFAPVSNTPIKALTGLKLIPKQQGEKSSNIQEYQNKLNQAIIESGWLNLTFITADTSKIGSFHDRFLIFPKTLDTPARAWSLGTSVNSLGKSHHIIQEVQDGQIIADAFEEMWGQSIQNEGSIIWKSN